MEEILEKALAGEIYGNIWHNPDPAELETVKKHLADYVADLAAQKKRLDLTALAVGVADAVHDHFLECEECSEKFLPDEMNHDGDWYCLQCRPYSDPDGMPGGWHDVQIERAEGGE